MHWGYTAGHGGKTQAESEGTLCGLLACRLTQQWNAATHRWWCLCPRKPSIASARVFIEGWLLRHPLPGKYQNCWLPERKQVFSINRSLCSLATVNLHGQLVSAGDTLSTRFQDASLRPAVLTPCHTDNKPCKPLNCVHQLYQRFHYGSLRVFVSVF